MFIFKKRLMITVAALFLGSVLYGCGDVKAPANPSGEIPTPEAEDPYIVNVSPANGATGLPRDINVVIEFSEPMDEFTFRENIEILKIKDNLGRTSLFNVAFEYRIEDNYVIFSPANSASPLENNTTYRARIKEGVTDLAGNPITNIYEWSFTTGSNEVSEPPVIVSKIPDNGANDFGLNIPLLVFFDSHLDLTTVNTDVYKLTYLEPSLGIEVEVEGSVEVRYYNKALVIQPAADLIPSTQYTVTIYGEASGNTFLKNVSGLGMENDETWSFTTGTEANNDSTPPTVDYCYPAASEPDAPVDSSLFVVFSENMDHRTINTGTFTVRDSANNNIEGQVFYDYSMPVEDEVLSRDGLNVADTLDKYPLSPNSITISWNGTIGTDNGSGVISGAGINGTGTIDYNTGAISFTLLTDPGSDPVTITYTNKVKATFIPTNELPSETLITATVTTGVTDMVGLPIADTYEWSFTTEDITGPEVVSTDPAEDAVGVDGSSSVSVYFNEEIEETSIEDISNFLVRDESGSIVPGTIVYTYTADPFESKAVFTPGVGSEFIEDGLTYTVTLTTGIMDASSNNNRMRYSQIWSFTTIDTIAPTIISSDPEDGGAAPINAVLSATFSEDVRNVETNFTLSNGSSVAGSVAYSNRVATFTPAANLTHGTVYYMNFSAGITDEAGNAMDPISLDFTASIISEKFPTGQAPVDTMISATFVTDMEDSSFITYYDWGSGSELNDGGSEDNLLTVNTVPANATFQVWNITDGVWVQGLVTYNNKKATFDPKADLTLDKRYEVRLTYDAARPTIDGIYYDNTTTSPFSIGNYTWQFITEPTWTKFANSDSISGATVTNTSLYVYDDHVTTPSVHAPVHYVAFVESDEDCVVMRSTDNGANWVSLGNANSTTTSEHPAVETETPSCLSLYVFDNGTAYGRPYVAFVTDDKKIMVRYYTGSGTTWANAGTIASGGFEPDSASEEIRHLSLHVADIGGIAVPYIAFSEFYNTLPFPWILTYNYYKTVCMRLNTTNGTTGTWVQVGSSGFMGDTAFDQVVLLDDGYQVNSTSIKVENGIPYVAYTRLAYDLMGTETQERAYIASYNGSVWSSTTVSNGAAADIALDIEDGILYVAYQDQNNSSMLTVKRYGSSWSVLGNAGISDGIAADITLFVLNGIPYVGYNDASNGNGATVQKFENYEWSVLGAKGFGAGAVTYNSISVFDDGSIIPKPFIVFMDPSDPVQNGQAVLMQYANTCGDPQ